MQKACSSGSVSSKCKDAYGLGWPAARCTRPCSAASAAKQLLQMIGRPNLEQELHPADT